jgi:hypothetical protein
MTHNRILSIYCSKEDCITILSEKRYSFPNIYLSTTAVKINASLKKICSNQRKRYTLQQGDYIIAIDNSAKCVFKKDYEANNLLHFASLSQFLQWMGDTFA